LLPLAQPEEVVHARRRAEYEPHEPGALGFTLPALGALEASDAGRIKL
jgi:hypothetical protein